MPERQASGVAPAPAPPCPWLHSSGCCRTPASCVSCVRFPEGLAAPGRRPSHITPCPQHMAEWAQRTSSAWWSGPQSCLIVTSTRSQVSGTSWGPGAKVYTPSAEGLGSILGQGTDPAMPQLRVCLLQPELTCSAAKTEGSQINKYKKKRRSQASDPDSGVAVRL